MYIHFIAIGGAAMHNLAIALHLKGNIVTGSDDEIFEPSESRLSKYDLLPKEFGWFPEKLSDKTDAVILGMHAREDNPELQRAKELNLSIYSYPEYLFEQSKNKIRVVIGGSHGKTTITAMVLHVLQQLGHAPDYMVGSKLDGFEVMVRLSEESKIMVLEGDEYLSSPIDHRPKFHLYKPNIALLSGIAWDHMNVFPTFENYIEQFKTFIDLIEENGILVYSANDKNVMELADGRRDTITAFPYRGCDSLIKKGQTFIVFEAKRYPLQVFGEHNLQNINGARWVCQALGVRPIEFFNAITSFSGTSNRLELIAKNEKTIIYKDFAHSPSKLKATTSAVKEQFEETKLLACMELHTFSSLNKAFLSQYAGAMDNADIPIVYYNPKTLEHKKLPPISIAEIKLAFTNDQLEVFTDTIQLQEFLFKQNWQNMNLLLMSSGNFGGMDYNAIANEILGTEMNSDH
ncbi:MAG: Mur ligase family protein [Bacteroidales bacterium]|jgi:UDP-N-acetylmuramate: L-alanyl-gamma-D-glutamyl-meso-diaminopimelate ligase|nr:Mur ligase family protein [Bacteroidales bacterium]